MRRLLRTKSTSLSRSPQTSNKAQLDNWGLWMHSKVLLCPFSSFRTSMSLKYPALLGVTVTSKAAPVQTLAVENVGVNAAGASVATSSAATKATKAGKGAGKATAAAASTATATAATKKGKNNNKRDSSLKWAKRAVLEDSI